MTLIDRDMRELAAVRSDGEPVASLYLNTRWDDEQQRGRVRIFTRDALRDARTHYAGKAGASFDRTAARIQDVVEQLARQDLDPEAGGVALFACDGLGLFRMLTFHTPFRSELRISDRPDLVQLAGMASRLRAMVVAVADAHGAEIVETDLGQVQADLELTTSAPHVPHQGGWSQSRYQRNARQLIRENMEPAANYLRGLCTADPRLLLVLAGPEPSISDFSRVLDDEVRARVFKRMPNPGSRDELVREAQDALAIFVRQDVERSLDAASGESVSRGLSALGQDDVLLAVNEGRVHELFMLEGLRQTGWRCLLCGALGAQAEQVCPYCAGELRSAELSAELTRRMVLEGGRVQLVEASPLLERYGGMCAVLRHGRHRFAPGPEASSPAH